MRSFPIRALTFLIWCVACAGYASGCRRGGDENASRRGDDMPIGEAPKADSVLVFPDDLRMADAGVNEFVARAMTTCAKGEYDAFRLLWSAREEPLPREEFEQGWQAVQTIRVRALEKVKLAPDARTTPPQDEVAYALLAEVSLDPTHKAGQREPQREVVLMLTREHDEWRLARAPKPMRNWVRDKVAQSSVSATDAVHPPPSQDNPD